MAETSRRRERRQVPYKKKPGAFHYIFPCLDMSYNTVVKAREEEESDNLKSEQLQDATLHNYKLARHNDGDMGSAGVFYVQSSWARPVTSTVSLHCGNSPLSRAV